MFKNILIIGFGLIGSSIARGALKAKITNQPFSKNLTDGLELNSTYITNYLKCAPPGDKPLNKELLNCSKYFDKLYLDNFTSRVCL